MFCALGIVFMSLRCAAQPRESISGTFPFAEELDKLITDRPENCRRPNKPAEAEVPNLGHAGAAQGRIGQLQPQPVMTLSLQAVPLRHQIQAQACMTPDSPAPAQTPPLHTLHNIHQSPLPPHLMSRAMDFLSVATDMSTEVDALDPSIMDFALQGKCWKQPPQSSNSLPNREAWRGLEGRIHPGLDNLPWDSSGLYHFWLVSFFGNLCLADLGTGPSGWSVWIRAAVFCSGVTGSASFPLVK